MNPAAAPSRLRTWARLAGDQRGLATVEFIVLLTCIAVFGIVAWKTMGETIVSIIGVKEREEGADGANESRPASP